MKHILLSLLLLSGFSSAAPIEKWLCNGQGLSHAEISVCRMQKLEELDKTLPKQTPKSFFQYRQDTCGRPLMLTESGDKEALDKYGNGADGVWFRCAVQTTLDYKKNLKNFQLLIK
ncbi:hypothetical protein [Leeia oryzae]|uniref:hypothetical protein n=1 Tax=Leeia oryzae TaxID=356662 RepID=UPI0003A7B60A|nr:hypothetical protein [Leeia oryzae]